MFVQPVLPMILGKDFCQFTWPLIRPDDTAPTTGGPPEVSYAEPLAAQGAQFVRLNSKGLNAW
jgi:hypothetical protein